MRKPFFIKITLVMILMLGYSSIWAVRGEMRPEPYAWEHEPSQTEPCKTLIGSERPGQQATVTQLPPAVPRSGILEHQPQEQQVIFEEIVTPKPQSAVTPKEQPTPALEIKGQPMAVTSFKPLPVSENQEKFLGAVKNVANRFEDLNRALGMSKTLDTPVEKIEELKAPERIETTEFPVQIKENKELLEVIQPQSEVKSEAASEVTSAVKTPQEPVAWPEVKTEKEPGTETQSVATALKTQKKESTSFIEENKKLLAAGGALGVGVLALGGILAAILGTTLDQKSSDQGVIIPSPYPGPTPSPEPFTTPSIELPVTPVVVDQGAITVIANFFTDIDVKFKKALETSSYFDKTFKIEGDVSIGQAATEKVSIEYDFVKGGADELGAPFTPFLITLLPQGINGVAITPTGIGDKIPDGPEKELFNALLKPNAAFVFMIKIILLINTTLRDDSKKDVEKIDFIIDEATKLYSRLVLTPGQDPSADAIISQMPKIFQQIISAISLKMYGDLVYSVNDPEKTALTQKIGDLGQLKGYQDITNFIKKEILPLIKSDLTHTEKQLLFYALEKHISQCPKTGKDLSKNLDQLDLLLAKIEKSIAAAKIDTPSVIKIKQLLANIKAVKAGTKRVTILAKKPVLEISTTIYNKKVQLNEVLKILFKNFSKIYYAKFEGDKDYVANDFLLGKQATKYALQSVLFRSLQDALNANQILHNTKGTVTLKLLGGEESVINPDQEFSKICNKSGLSFVAAQAKLKDIVTKLKNDPKNTQLKIDYDNAIMAINKASQDLCANQIAFMRKFSVYLPVTQDNRTKLTAADLTKKRLDVIRNVSKYVDDIIGAIYKPFANVLGFPVTFFGVNLSVNSRVAK
jgi:hypothetical protein